MVQTRGSCGLKNLEMKGHKGSLSLFEKLSGKLAGKLAEERADPMNWCRVGNGQTEGYAIVTINSRRKAIGARRGFVVKGSRGPWRVGRAVRGLKPWAQKAWPRVERPAGVCREVFWMCRTSGPGSDNQPPGRRPRFLGVGFRVQGSGGGYRAARAPAP